MLKIRTVCCRDDADTSIVKECLQESLLGKVEVRAEDSDILIMLVHHYDKDTNNFITVSTSNGSYCIDKIVEHLSYEQKKLSIILPRIFRMRYCKESLYKRLCCETLSPLLGVFYDDQSLILI